MFEQRLLKKKKKGGEKGMVAVESLLVATVPFPSRRGQRGVKRGLNLVYGHIREEKKREGERETSQE